MFFETSVHFVDVGFVPLSIVACREFVSYVVHRQDSPYMVYFEHSHWFPGLTQGDFDAFFFFENFKECF